MEEYVSLGSICVMCEYMCTYLKIFYKSNLSQITILLSLHIEISH